MLDQVRLLQLPEFPDGRGVLVVAESERHIPFPIARVFWIQGMAGESRGGHAHRATHQVMLAVQGGFRLDLSDGRDTRTWHLHAPGQAIYVPPFIWDRLYDFEPHTVVMCFASTLYDRADYMLDWNEFLTHGG